MSHSNTAQQLPNDPRLLFNLSARLTIGSAVFLTEGLAATLAAMAPRDIRFHIATTVISLVVWLAFFLYRNTKLGADISDLCFWDFFLHGVRLFMYFNSDKNAESEIFWYLFASFSMLKLIRVYVWYASETQRHGWGRFGPMTWHYAKHHLNPPTPWNKLAKEIIIAAACAVLASYLIKQLPALGRVAFMWIVPVAFEFLIGPRQLRLLGDFIPQFMASATRLGEKDAAIAKLKQGLGTENDDIGDPKLEAYIAHYLASSEEIRDHLVFYASTVADQFPITPPAKEE